MCGIIAAASTRNVGKLLVQGLHKMEYRGYDSAGIALHQNESIAHLRALGKVKLLYSFLNGGIGWPVTGAPGWARIIALSLVH